MGRGIFWALGVVVIAGGLIVPNSVRAEACSVSQRIKLADAGYNKVEIERMCGGTALSAPSSSNLTTKAGKVFRDCPSCPEMVVIPPGDFLMGSPLEEEGRTTVEGLQHRVKIAYSFAMGKTEVTQAEWAAVMGGNPSESKGSSRPVENVSWLDTQDFIQKLNFMTGETYRLPSEAEWEYAARSGTTTRYSWGNDVGRNKANCAGCGSRWDGKETAPVGSFSPNQFGLYDMHGNVFEWVQDCAFSDYSGAPTDGRAREKTESCVDRVVRGGCLIFPPGNVRSASRYYQARSNRDKYIGFRLVRELR